MTRLRDEFQLFKSFEISTNLKNKTMVGLEGVRRKIYESLMPHSTQPLFPNFSSSELHEAVKQG